MIKRVNILNAIALAILVVFLAQFCIASITITEPNIKDKYYLGEKVSGTLMLSIQNETTDSILSSNFGEAIRLLGLLKNNNQNYRGSLASCNPYSCSYKYLSSNPSLTKSININNSEERIFGFVVFGNKVKIVDISFDLSSNFGNSEAIPLKLNFFERTPWVYDIDSKDYSKSESWGCYNTDIQINDIGIQPSEKFEISSTSKYCEKIHLPESAWVRAGARIEANSQNELELSIYDEYAKELDVKDLNVSIKYVDVERSWEWNSEGDYFFCVGLKNKSKTVSGISIFQESYGSTCGWYVPQGYLLNQMISSNSTRDYSIYAKTSKYSAAELKTIDSYEIDSLRDSFIDSANYYLNLTYENKCTTGCIIPVIATGISQTLKINNSRISYEIISGSGGVVSDNKIYDLSKESAKLEFLGTLNLEATNFSIKSKTNSLILKLDNKNIFEKVISVYTGSSINSIYPKNPPAGMNTKFNVLIQSDTNITKYEWNFGDNETAETKVNSVNHIYKGIGTYNLNIRITDINGLSTAKSFVITTTSPSEFIKSDILGKSQRLDNLTRSIANFPIWYQDAIKDKINFSYYQQGIGDLQRMSVLTASDDQLIGIFMDLQKLDVPFYVFSSEKISSPLITSIDHIYPEIINEYAQEELINNSIEDYKTSIKDWQDKNIISNINIESIAYFNSESNIVPVLKVYNMNISNKLSNKAYLVINNKLEDLYFHDQEIELIGMGESTLIELNPGNNNLEFYDVSSEDLSSFVSPKLSQLNVITLIEKCNANKICEKSLGENWRNCRSDCKPYNLLYVYVFILILLLFGFYTFLAWWYKNNYELSLFKDKKSAYNLTMFILNSRFNGSNDWKIKDMLRQQSWNLEQINYAFKKADGKRIGFPEIIPIEKIKLRFMKKKAKKNAVITADQRIIKW